MGFEGYEVTFLSGVGSSVRSVPSSCWGGARGGDITEGSSVTDPGETITTGVIGILSVTASDEWILAVLRVLWQQPIGRYLSSSSCVRFL
jgi:hypothetical protein